MENKTFDQLWEDFRIENPNTVGTLQEQYESFKWLYNRLRGTVDDSVRMKQNNMTAVDWLVGQINLYLHNGWDKEEFTVRVPKDLVEQAKQMEKEQIMDAHYVGFKNFVDTKEISEQYYNETYNK